MSTSNFSSLLSPYRESRRIPPGTVLAEIPLEAAKAYAVHLFDGLNVPIRIAYADRNTHDQESSCSQEPKRKRLAFQFTETKTCLKNS